MRPPPAARLHRSVLAVAAGLLLVVALPVAVAAQEPGADTLRERGRDLAAQERAAVVELYALESRLAGARREVALVRARRDELQRQQQSAAKRFRVAQQTLRVAQHRLGAQLVLLYQADEPDPLAILLGATSLTEALDGLDSLDRTARVTDNVIESAREAKARVAKERRVLAQRRAAVERLAARASAALESLLSASEQKAAYIEQLRTQRRLNEQQIAAVEQRAREAQERAEEIARTSTPTAPSGDDEPAQSPEPGPPAPPLPTGEEEEPDSGGDAPQENPAEEGGEAPPTQPPPSAPPPQSGKRLRVSATAYCLSGTTATGLPVGPGIVAVDPSVIPLGTRMTIPGYGEGVAADTGGAIKGYKIDLWMPCAQANVYGVKSLTITLH